MVKDLTAFDKVEFNEILLNTLNENINLDMSIYEQLKVFLTFFPAPLTK